MSRRTVLKGTAFAGFGAFLAACGASGQGTAAPSAAPPSGAPGASAAPGASQAPAASESPSAELNFANWPLYIDTDDNDTTKHKTLEDFTAKYGTVVNYSEVINDNDEFFGTIQPALQGGQDTGWDLIVHTDWMAARLIRLGWVEQLNLANMPNKVANMQDVYKGVDWDATDDHHAPWQSGMTGLGFDTPVTGELTSLDALWTTDPRWTGKVTFLTEMRDTVGLTMLRQGKDPSQASEADLDAVMADIQKAVDDGIVRGFMGNEYAEEMVSGNVVLAMAWSGDIIVKQAEKATLAWQLPDQGAHALDRQHAHPEGRRPQVHGRADDRLRVRPADCGADRRMGELRHAGEGREGSARGGGSRARREPADLPARRRARQSAHLQGPVRGRGVGLQRQVLRGHGQLAPPEASARWVRDSGSGG